MAYDRFLQEGSINKAAKVLPHTELQIPFDPSTPSNHPHEQYPLFPGQEADSLFLDDNHYYESVSVDLEQEEFNKLQYYKNMIDTLI